MDIVLHIRRGDGDGDDDGGDELEVLGRDVQPQRQRDDQAVDDAAEQTQTTRLPVPPRRPAKTSPMIRLASAIVTMPVPRLMSQNLLYSPIRQPASAVRAFARHRPIVMVTLGLMEEALTMSRLSPVARMESPSDVPKTG